MPLKIDLLSYEKGLWEKGIKFIAGIDEAGRGPWAGPVVAAAVVLGENFYLPGLIDSKKLSPKKRDEFCMAIKENALCWGVGVIEPEEIDNLNILQATFKAMRNAVDNLSARPQFLLVDGSHRIPGIDIPQLAIVKGDGLSLSIAAASVLAKVTRDGIMQKLDVKFPVYGFSRHKGYGTREHANRLKRFGPSRLHRFSFRPVKKSARAALGRWGEERAIRFLEAQGYKILGRNIRTRRGELDILAEDGNAVTFIEVKTRLGDGFGRGEEAVSLTKQRRLVNLAFQIMKKYNLKGRDFRFDILSVYCDKGKGWNVELIKNAFEAI